jgi:hypothetical protein
VPYLRTTILGAIWYQGEANAGADGRQYNCSFQARPDKGFLSFRTTMCARVGHLHSNEDGAKIHYARPSVQAMIEDWRLKWAEGTGGATSPTFPFGWAQLNSGEPCLCRSASYSLAARRVVWRAV